MLLASAGKNTEHAQRFSPQKSQKRLDYFFHKYYTTNMALTLTANTTTRASASVRSLPAANSKASALCALTGSRLTAHGSRLIIP
jgi:hypothetical protein